MIFKHIQKVITIVLLGIFIGLLMPNSEAYGQILLHDKRLKTAKQEKKKKRRKFFQMKNREDSKATDVEIRTTEYSGKVKDKRTLDSPEPRERTQNYDRNAQEYNRPYRPELNYEGYRKAKREKRNPSKDAADYSGKLKSSSLIVKPQRGGVNTKQARGKSQQAIERDFKQKSKTEQAYTGNMKSSTAIVKPGRAGAYYSGKTHKGKSEKARKKELQSKSNEMQLFTGHMKVSNAYKSNGTKVAGRIKVPSLSAKTKYFKKLSKNINQYQGNIKFKKSKLKDQHPSVAYLEGKKKKSEADKEKLRKRKIFWFRFWKNSDQPKSVKQKPAKPKYDSHESEIWYE